MNPFRPPALWSLAASPLAALYRGVTSARAALYARGRFRAGRLEHPVVSVGNLTVGGTGKTPVTAWLARELGAAGRKPVILSRGYGGERPAGWHRDRVMLVSDGVKIHLGPRWAGDEPYWLAWKLPGVPVVCHPERERAGRWAGRNLAVDLFLLDDGFQHLALHRDFNLLLLDGTAPLGNGRVLPAGPLRESPRAMERADAILLTRCPAARAGDAQAQIRRWSGDIPVFSSEFAPVRLLHRDGTDAGPMEAFRGRRMVACAGIARPDQFFRMLADAGLNVVETIAFSDHQAYGPAEAERLAAACRAAGAEMVVTTEKDLVKMQELPPDLAVHALEIELRLHQPGLLPLLLDAVLTTKAQSKPFVI
jgi:tetraacyldisaccharide 4'-kinase